MTSQPLTLLESVSRLVDIDYLDPLQLGQSIRILIDIHKPSKHDLEEMTKSLVKSLSDTPVLRDSEFYEGLHKSIRTRFLVRSLREAFLQYDDPDPQKEPCEFCSLISSLAPIVDLLHGNLHELRSHASSAHIKSIISRIADSTIDDIASLAQLLRKFFHPSEQFEVADALAFCVRTDWFQDIVPQSPDKARLVFDKHLISVFPSTKTVLENFLENVCDDSDADASSDRGSSLADFIVTDSDCSDLVLSEEEDSDSSTDSMNW